MCVFLFLLPVEFSGSWGYGSPSNPTYECIRFNASQEVLLGGIGLFAGRGEYKADITVSSVASNLSTYHPFTYMF